MNKFGKLIFFVIFVFLGNILFAQTGTRVFEPNGNFSYRPPLGWTLIEFPGLVYKMVTGPTEEGFAANINFIIDETFSGTLNAFSNLYISNTQAQMLESRVVSRSEFKTHSGIIGERIVFINVYNRMTLRQIACNFPLSRNTFMSITASVLDSVSSRFIPLFDESIMSFELIN